MFTETREAIPVGLRWYERLRDLTGALQEPTSTLLVGLPHRVQDEELKVPNAKQLRERGSENGLTVEEVREVFGAPRDDVSLRQPFAHSLLHVRSQRCRQRNIGHQDVAVGIWALDSFLLRLDRLPE